jgi:hypothetical protein
MALIVLSGGCARVYALHAGELAPSLASVAPETRIAVWQRAVVVLLDQGYVPQVVNDVAGYISAHRRDDLSDDALAGTTALVTVSPEGVVRVALAGAGTFHSQQEFLQAVTERQNLLTKLIVAPPGTPSLPRQ